MDDGAHPLDAPAHATGDRQMTYCKACQREVEDPCHGSNAFTSTDPVCRQSGKDTLMKLSMKPHVPDILQGKDQRAMLNMPTLLHMLSTGMTAIRRGWPEGQYIALREKQLFLVYEDYKGVWHPTQKDLMADDWEIGR